jgi:putative flippase GtrA
MSLDRLEIVRYVVNGTIATIAHYFLLYLCIERYDFDSAGLANLLASLVGIFLSFMGNRYIVFKNAGQKMFSQFLKFSLLYIGIALMHGGFIYVWTDVLSKSYHYGFAIAVTIQLVFAYCGCRRFVFRELTGDRVCELKI